MAYSIAPALYSSIDGGTTKQATAITRGESKVSKLYQLTTDAVSGSFTVPFQKIDAILGLPALSSANYPTITYDGLGNATVTFAGGLTSTVIYTLEIIGNA